MTDDSRVTIDRLDLGTGWVCFEAGDSPPAPEALPQLLHRTLCDWLARNSQFRVRATLPIVSDGRTVAIHVWFD